MLFSFEILTKTAILSFVITNLHIYIILYHITISFLLLWVYGLRADGRPKKCSHLSLPRLVIHDNNYKFVIKKNKKFSKSTNKWW